MLQILTSRDCQLRPLAVSDGATVPENAVWVDLLRPTREEELFVEKALGVALPTREEMQEIEPSNRLYQDDSGLFMAGNVVAKADSPARARQLADQVTQQYVAFSTEILTRSASVPGEVLAPRKDSLQKQVADMNRRISELEGSVGLVTAANAQGAAARAELQRLGNDRTDAVKELNDLDGQIAKAQAQAAASRANFSVIEPPVAPPSPVSPARLELVAGGAAFTAALGAFGLVAVRHADRRLRRGLDIAAALGAPVLGTVEAPAEAAVTSPTNGSLNGHNAGGQRALLQRLLGNGAPWDVRQGVASHDQSLEYVRYRRVLGRLRAAPEESVRLLVVVVDDDVLVRDVVGRYLRQAGYQVTVAGDGVDALRAAKAAPPDLVVLDLMLPGMSGLEVCRQVREESNIPIIVLSVKGSEHDKVQALDLGADDYIPKPFGMNEVLARVPGGLRPMPACHIGDGEEGFPDFGGPVGDPVGHLRLSVSQPCPCRVDPPGQFLAEWVSLQYRRLRRRSATPSLPRRGSGFADFR